MFFPSSNIILQYYSPVMLGIVGGLICKAYFAVQMQNKVNDCENELMKSQEKIFDLKAQNEQLSQRIKEMESCFSKDSISMN